MGQPHGGATAKSSVKSRMPPCRCLAALRADGPGGQRCSTARTANNHATCRPAHTIGGTRTILADRYFTATADSSSTPGQERSRPLRTRNLGNARDGLVQFDGSQVNAYAWKEMESVDRKGKKVAYRGLEPPGPSDRRWRPTRSRRNSRKLLPESTRLKSICYENRMEFTPLATETRPASLSQYFAQSRPELRAVGVSTTPFLPATYESRYGSSSRATKPSAVATAGSRSSTCRTSGSAGHTGIRSRGTRAGGLRPDGCLRPAPIRGFSTR